MLITTMSRFSTSCGVALCVVACLPVRGDILEDTSYEMQEECQYAFVGRVLQDVGFVLSDIVNGNVECACYERMCHDVCVAVRLLKEKFAHDETMRTQLIEDLHRDQQTIQISGDEAPVVRGAAFLACLKSLESKCAEYVEQQRTQITVHEKAIYRYKNLLNNFSWLSSWRLDEIISTLQARIEMCEAKVNNLEKLQIAFNDFNNYVQSFVVNSTDAYYNTYNVLVVCGNVVNNGTIGANG